jgi:hypothetical protein
MKRFALFFAVLTLVYITPVLSQAANLAYYPPNVSLTVEPGGYATVSCTVAISDSGSDTYWLWYFDSISTNSLPATWLSVSPSSAFIGYLWPTKSADLTVNVPGGLPRVYTQVPFIQRQPLPMILQTRVPDLLLT